VKVRHRHPTHGPPKGGGAPSPRLPSRSRGGRPPRPREETR
jgi:hypothetical protein